MATNTKTQKAKIEIQIKEWEFSIITQKKKKRALLDKTLTFGWTARWYTQKSHFTISGSHQVIDGYKHKNPKSKNWNPN